MWKTAFYARYPITAAYGTENIQNYRVAFVTQLHKERQVSQIFSKEEVPARDSLPVSIEYKGTATRAPQAPLSDSYRLGCILENNESQKIFRSLISAYPSLKLSTQGGVRRLLFLDV